MRLTNILAFLAAPLLVTAKRTLINGTDVGYSLYKHIRTPKRANGSMLVAAH